MKANIPKSWLSLPEREKKAISKMVEEEINKTVDHEEAELQKIWIQFACIILHDAFGFGAQRLTVFLGNWKRIYNKNKKFSCEEEQTEFLRKEIESIFGVGGYPSEWIDSLEGRD